MVLSRTNYLFQIVKKRNDEEHVRGELKAALNRELKWLDEKREIEEQAAAILGEDVAKKIQEFQDTRNEAYAAS